MGACDRSDCFACLCGRCLALWDTSGQDKCRFYRTDLSMRKINRELAEKSGSAKKEKVLPVDVC